MVVAGRIVKIDNIGVMTEGVSTLAQLESELDTFRVRYRREVGRRHEELDELDYAIAELELAELALCLVLLGRPPTASSAWIAVDVACCFSPTMFGLRRASPIWCALCSAKPAFLTIGNMLIGPASPDCCQQTLKQSGRWTQTRVRASRGFC
jgi:hypothetical protein